MNIRALMQARYPEADFSTYFRHLEACRCAKSESGKTHEHHIAPRKQFPELSEEPENIITLHIDDHVFAHKLLGAVHKDFNKVQAAWIAAQANLTFLAANGRRGSKVLKELWKDASFVQKTLAARKEPKRRARLSVAMSRAEVKDSLRRYTASIRYDVHRKKLSVARKEFYKNPDNRAAHCAAMKTVMNQVSIKERCSASAKNRWYKYWMQEQEKLYHSLSVQTVEQS